MWGLGIKRIARRGQKMNCRSCMSDVSEQIDFGTHPISHKLWDSESEVAMSHTVRLGHCFACGLTQLMDEVPEDVLYAEYDPSGQKHQPHAEELSKWIENKGLTVEIGCNDGGFLELLKRRGFDSLLGIEPSDTADIAMGKGFPVIKDYFGLGFWQRPSKQAKCVIAREVLEHVPDVNGFMRGISEMLDEGGKVLIEVPDFEHPLRNGDYSVIWEEHLSYFTQHILENLLMKHGFRVLRWKQFDYSGRVMAVLAEKVDCAMPYYLIDDSLINGYVGLWPTFLENVHRYFQNRYDVSFSVYGAGCRACSLLNFADIAKYFHFVVDDNSKRIGKFFPAGGMEILNSPGDSDVCFLAVNEENERKVIERNPDFKGRFTSLFPPEGEMYA